jgi:hypothetical protein
MSHSSSVTVHRQHQSKQFIDTKESIFTVQQIWKLSACISPSIPGRHLALTACPIWRLAFVLTSPTARARTHQQPAWTAVSIASLYQRPLARRYLLFSTSTPSLRTASRAWRPLMLSSATIDLPTTGHTERANLLQLPPTVLTETRVVCISRGDDSTNIMRPEACTVHRARRRTRCSLLRLLPKASPGRYLPPTIPGKANYFRVLHQRPHCLAAQHLHRVRPVAWSPTT